MKTTKARKYNSKILNKIFSDIPKSLDKQVASTMVIAALIDDEMKKNNLSIEDVAKIFKVKPDTIENWLSGTFDFRISSLCKIEEKIGIELFKITKYVKVVINDKASIDHGINSSEFTTKKLKEYINIGYRPRMDGSIIASSDLTCNCCAKRIPSLIMLVHDYPTYSDVGLCSECYIEYDKLINSHE